MKKIIFEFDYGIKPIRIYDENDRYIDAGELPDDIADNVELEQLLNELCDDYMDLFIDNSVEFSYRGFLDKNQAIVFREKMMRTISLLKEVTKDKYIVEVNDISM